MGCLLLFKQFLLLLWKNFILQIRRPIGTVFELILPALAVVVIIGLRFSDLFPTRDRCFLTFELDSLTIPEGVGHLYNIFFTPNNTATIEIMHRVIERLGVPIKIMGFDSESVMVNNLAATPRTLTQTCFAHGAGIVFDNLNGTNIEYTLRLRHEVEPDNSWETARRGPAFQLPGSRVSPNFYLEEGFLHLQNAVSLSIIESLADKTINLQVSVEQFPYPPYRVDFFLQAVGAFLPLLLVMAFLYSAGVLVKELVLEKESRIRETMLMMGLKQWTLWSSWYLKQFIFFMVSIIMISILVKLGQIFPQSDFLLLLLFFSSFILSMISFCFFISVWFNSARVGLIVGFVAWFVNYFPFLFIPQRYASLSFGAKVGSCILSNTCLGLGVEVISRLEQRLEGLQWNNVATPLSADDDFNMAWVFGMLLIDAIGYMALSWYINGVKPGQYGVPKPFYFPCLPSYWSGTPRRSKIVEPKSTVAGHSSNHEDVSNDLKVGIGITNLTKIYGQSLLDRLFSNKSKKKPKKKAVDNVTLNMYEGQITALLGHNGAGKTTTMSILTGLYTPTSGEAVINGFNILTDMDQIRKSLGICPQHNILFDRLTVSEHLSFFLRLKGVFNRDRVRSEVKAMVADLQLVDKAHIQASRLSGGMKRKLSIAIALIGGSEVVILDEPTSGMDPYARRATWDLLAKYKVGRTILLTTHFMDEADLLGDRIAIMAEGKLHCSGSSLFLKSRYGIGYHMTIVKDASCDPSRVEKLVKSLAPKAEQVTNVGAELSYILPSSSTPSFPELFDRLETEKTALGIVSFGVSVTTMEEVFMKVGEGATDETLNERLHRSGTLSPAWSGNPTKTIADVTQNSAIVIENLESESENTEVQVATLDMSRDEFDDSPLPGNVSRPSIIDLAEAVYKPDTKTPKFKLKEELLCYTFTPNTGVLLWLQQFWAMFTKRFYNSLRFYAAVVSQIFFPILFVLFGMVLAVTGPGRDQDDPKRVLTLKNSALFGGNLSLFYAQLGEVGVENTSFILSGLELSDLGATNVFDYTDEIWQIKDRADISSQNFTLNDCCSYKYQLLDQFCVSRSYQLLNKTCALQNDFGYTACSQCLQCCQSTTETRSILKSCTNPLSLVFPFDGFTSGRFCPTPPKLSYSSLQKSIPRGSLESDNIYIAEHLLRTADTIKPDVFFRRFQAGFSLSYSEPSYSVCGCNATQDICDFITPLRASSSGQCPRYSIDQQCALSWTACYAFPQSCRAIMDDCRRFNSLSGPGIRQNENLSNCTIASNATIILQSCRTIMEDCIAIGNVSDFDTACNDTSSNCSTVDRLLADIMQSCGAINDCRNFGNVSEDLDMEILDGLSDDIVHSCRSLVGDCTLLGNILNSMIECNDTGTNCSMLDGSSAYILQSCTAIVEGCENITDPEITCNDSTVYGLPLDDMQHGIECNQTLSSCSIIDGLSADILQYGACGRLTTLGLACPIQEQIMGAVYPDRDRRIEATVWYNNQPFHMPAAALNAFHNVLLRSVTGDDALTIVVNNHPLPRNNASVQVDDAATDPTGFGISVLVVFGYSFLLASFVLFLVKEKESKAKHLQFVSGVHSSSYWLATFAWDLLNALVPIIISVIIFAAFRVDAFSSPEALVAIFILLVLTTWACIPLTYMASFIFSNSLAAFSLLMIFFFFSSMLLQTVIFVLQSSDGNEGITDKLNYVFLVFPTFGLSSAFNDLYINQNLKEVCQQPEVQAFCANSTTFNFVDNPLEFNKPGIGLTLLYMFAEGIIFFIITLFIQNKFFFPDLKALLKTNGADSTVSTSLLKEEDNDVHAEAQRVLGGNTNEDDVVIIKNLVKVYSPHLSGCRIKPAKRAVDGVSLAIPNGECFGLLGVNGAGKTTTFSILTGDFTMTSGTAVIAGYDIRTHLRDVQQRIGYCPQFDALIERLTGRELLTMFARLRGVPEKQIKEVVETEITRLDLKKYADKKCGNYSGGNKRKLSTAIALVGNPPIVLLDEPTTGMDPTTRRYLWNVLTGITKEGRSIVLTSHSMEECEALCTRLAIMVNGSFKCLGSIQHLKNKFGSGLTLQAKVKLRPPPEEPALHRTSSKRFSFRQPHRSRSQTPAAPADGEVHSNPSVADEAPIPLSGGGIDSPAKSAFNPYDTTSLHIFLRETFPGAVLLEEHQGAIMYQLPSTNLSWSSIFRQIESNKERLGIVDYSVSQTTLEQVFVTFAKEQDEE